MEISDPWTALQFDNAVSLIGNGIENAAQEMEKVGSDDKPEWRPKYTMKQLLDPGFRLPAVDGGGDISELMGIQGVLYDEVG